MTRKSQKNKKRKLKRIKIIREHLVVAIKKFDSSEYKNQNDGSRSLVYDDHKSLRDDLPLLIESYRKQGKINIQQAKTFNMQVGSPDRDDWFMAFVCLDQIKGKKYGPPTAL